MVRGEAGVTGVPRFLHVSLRQSLVVATLGGGIVAGIGVLIGIS